jgi:ABC-type branched-subunit amino acid transport system ATPase component/ABC-type branched-subunit amino acid transport system permease subunit
LFSGSWTTALITTCIYSIICLSLVVVTGYAGQLSLAQYTVAGIGALVSTRLNDAEHIPFELAALLGIAATVPVALLVALPALRARGVNLAVATMGLSVVIFSVVFSNPDYTGGIITGTVVPPPKIFGIDIYVGDHPARYAIVCLAALALLALMVANLRRGRPGRSLIAVRDNERAAASLGISIVGAKLFAFSVAGVIAGVAGVLLAYETPNVTFSAYDVFASINVVLLAVIGGIGYISGGILGGAGGSGAAVQSWLSHVFNVTGWFGFGAAVLLVITVIFSPDGVVHANLEATAKLRARLARGREERRARVRQARIDALLGEEPSGAATSGADPASTAIVDKVAPKAFELRNVSLRFGGIVALDGVNLSVAPGEVLGLIGPNGAGKTTLIDVSTAFYRHYQGSVLLDGKPIDKLNPVHRARRGVTRSFQSLELFEDLTVAANLRAASDERGLLVWLADLLRPHRGPLSSGATAAVREFDLTDCLAKTPGELPYAQRRLVAIARAVATMPSVLLLDEPAAGLDERSTRELGRLLRRLAREWGMGIILVEHDVPMVLSTCDRVVAIKFGKVIATGTPDEIRNNEEVIAAYLGTSADPLKDDPKAQTGKASV